VSYRNSFITSVLHKSADIEKLCELLRFAVESPQIYGDCVVYGVFKSGHPGYIRGEFAERLAAVLPTTDIDEFSLMIAGEEWGDRLHLHWSSVALHIVEQVACEAIEHTCGGMYDISCEACQELWAARDAANGPAEPEPRYEPDDRDVVGGL
jgi:hypothetical protein